MSRPTAVVVGGGLAGLAAAVRLSDAGMAVTLLEARPRLGGAACSFRRDGLTIDNGQHVILRCYTEYRRFLDRIGTTDRIAIQDRFAVPILANGRVNWLRRNGLPAPAHLAGALLRYRPLGLADRPRAVRAALALRALDPDDPALDQRAFGDWLAEHRQSDRAVAALWEPFTVAALNAPVRDVSLALATRVFRTGLLSHADAADIGIPRVPLDDLHARPAATLLARLGADVRRSAKATAIRPAGDRLEVTTADDILTADIVILAAPHKAATALLPAGALPGDSGARSDQLGAAPIVNAHIVYDRKVTDLRFAATLDSPVQWVFDRTQVTGLGLGQYLAVSLSAADQHIDTPTAALRQSLLPALADLFPTARHARVTTFFVTRERRATFRQVPGSRALRPVARTRIPGLMIAGAWTATGWPDVMEGAVRSGNEAARLALAHRPGTREGQAVTA